MLIAEANKEQVYSTYAQYTDRTVLTRKEADDVLGGEDAWKNVDQTEGMFRACCNPDAHADSITVQAIVANEWFYYFYLAQCPKCENNRAFYMQLQIRSADEPMTTFYR